jgi:transposase
LNILKKIIDYSRSLKRFVADLSNELNLIISISILKRFLKRLGYSWKRFRKSLKKKQYKEEYETKYQELKQLIKLYQENYISLYFADESAFNLEGYVPYGWQPKGEYLTITPSKSLSTKIFGIMNLDNELHAYSTQGSMDSQTVITFIDDFHKKITKPTVIVMDNAPIHKSHDFQQKIKQWKEEDLFIFFLPTYSPHLNPIEILWRMIKYQWLAYEKIQNNEELVKELERILRAVGSEYFIDFKDNKNVVLI